MRKAGSDLRIAMIFAAITFVALLVALLLALFTQSAEPTLVAVRVFAPGDMENVLACGEYATADANSVTVTKENGATETRPWAEVGKVSAVRSC